MEEVAEDELVHEVEEDVPCMEEVAVDELVHEVAVDELVDALEDEVEHKE